MAKKIVTLTAADGWVELSEADVTTFTAIHWSGSTVVLEPTTGAAPAASQALGKPIGTDHGIPSGFLKTALADLTFTVSPTRMFARVLNGRAKVLYEDDE